MESILINRISGLGDILMTTAVVREIRISNPDIYISYRTNHPELLEGNSDINEIIKADSGLTGNETFDKEYDKIIDLDFCVESKMVDTKKGKVSEYEYMNITRIDLFFKAAEMETPEYPKMKYLINPEEELYAKNIIKTLKGRYTVVYNLNSVSPIRTYPIDLAVELIRLLLSQKINVITIGTIDKLWGNKWHPFNKYFLKEIETFNKEYFINLSDATNIRESIALIGNSNLTITSDTGVLHVTNVIGIPCIGLFGNIDPMLRCYYYDNVRTLYKKIKCSDCGDRGSIMNEKCPSIMDTLDIDIRRVGAECMRAISPKEIFDLSLEILGYLTDGIANSETSRIRQYVLPYCYGRGLDIGAVGGCGQQSWEYGVKSDSIIVDLRQARQPSVISDARYLKTTGDKSMDYVYSSHMLEDLIDEDKLSCLNEWLRVIKDNGFLIIYCPVQKVYKRHCELTNQPLNRDHKVEHFSLRYIKNKLQKSNYKYDIIGEILLMNNYSFLLIIRKKG
jgi:ADP-heptose:LPS heptosyltransferase/predicted SAM-dependent methyltransferase